MATAPKRTMVCFHAHPDDEAIATGGTIARVAADGHRVVLVVASRGELGETDALGPGETLAERRTAEVQRAAEILGIARVEFLPYRDSGMADDPRIADAGTFHAAPVDEAAEHLAAILREEDAAVLTVYDDHGTYGHPDHIKVHHVGYRAAELAGTPRVLEATVNRDYLETLPRPTDAGMPEGVEIPDFEAMDLGVRESRITTWIPVGDLAETKRAAIGAHSSQVGETSFFLQLPPDAFREVFGWEWFICRDEEPGGRSDRIF
jgi:LmbE family N-acetylglucosaminyl deacetylase